MVGSEITGDLQRAIANFEAHKNVTDLWWWSYDCGKIVDDIETMLNVSVTGYVHC